jgi:hypothetical protein
MKLQTRSVPLSLLVCALTIAACHRDPTAPVVPVPPEILVAPTQLSIGAATLRVSPQLWRNFQPSLEGEPEPPLIARVLVRADDPNTFPSDLRIERAWLVFGRRAWVVEPSLYGPALMPPALEMMARGGPAWPIGAAVTVVVELRDISERSYLLRANPEPIGRVE